MTLAALQVTLQHYVRGEAERKIPVWRMMARSLPDLQAQATSWQQRLLAHWPTAQLLEGLSTVGGGSLPGETFPTWLLALPVAPGRATALQTALRHHVPPIICRIEHETLLFDPRTILPGQEEILLTALEGLKNQ